jgi:hypothetical protein
MAGKHQLSSTNMGTNEMLKKIIILVIFGFILSTTVSGCQQLGRQTGEGVDKVEEGAEDFKEGYDEGRSK